MIKNFLKSKKLDQLIKKSLYLHNKEDYKIDLDSELKEDLEAILDLKTKINSKYNNDNQDKKNNINILLNLLKTSKKISLDEFKKIITIDELSMMIKFQIRLNFLNDLAFILNDSSYYNAFYERAYDNKNFDKEIEKNFSSKFMKGIGEEGEKFITNLKKVSKKKKWYNNWKIFKRKSKEFIIVFDDNHNKDFVAIRILSLSSIIISEIPCCIAIAASMAYSRSQEANISLNKLRLIKNIKNISFIFFFSLLLFNLISFAIFIIFAENKVDKDLDKELFINSLTKLNKNLNFSNKKILEFLNEDENLFQLFLDKENFFKNKLKELVGEESANIFDKKINDLYNSIKIYGINCIKQSKMENKYKYMNSVNNQQLNKPNESVFNIEILYDDTIINLTNVASIKNEEKVTQQTNK